MLFARSYLFTIIGLLILVLAVFLTYFIPFIIILIFLMLGIMLIITSIVLLHLRAVNSTLIYLLEDPKRGFINWLYAYGDYDMRVTPARRKLEKHSYSKKLDQQIRDFRTYRLAGHSVRIVPEGVGHSVDLGKCLYATYAKREWNIKSLGELRSAVTGIFSQKKEIPYEKIATLEEYKDMHSKIDEVKENEK